MVGHLRCPESHLDLVFYHLAEMIRPYVCQRLELPGLFLDEYLQMLCGHLVLTYSALPLTRQLYRGGLAPWQKRRTLECLEQNLSGEDVRLKRLAAECGVSASYFCRCFRVTFGTSLHKFVMNKESNARNSFSCTPGFRSLKSRLKRAFQTRRPSAERSQRI
jgi:AraC-like DNA-binding protein